MIDEILRKYLHEVDMNRSRYPGLNVDHFLEVHSEALTAIYEIGLGVIGEDEDINPLEHSIKVDLEAFAHNQLRASQRKAWAKACGVAEK